MFRISPIFHVYFVTFALLMLMLLFWLDMTGLVSFPAHFFQACITLLLLTFCLWPIDLLVNWEKRTNASIQKDKVLLVAALTVILFIYPYRWLATPFWPTLLFAVGVGTGIPLLAWMTLFAKKKRTVVSAGMVYRVGMQSPRAEEFMQNFPDAKQYVIGTTEGEGEFAHLLLHQRKPYDQVPDSWIDYVLDITVDRRLGIYVGNAEKLQCYLFRNENENAGVGFLSSTNIARALDYGFSDDEMEKAVNEVTTLDHRWAALGSAPLMIQHYTGKVIRMR